jgi:hypothetical protein
MQRSGIRGFSWRGAILDFAALHPGYEFGRDDGAAFDCCSVCAYELDPG